MLLAQNLWINIWEFIKFQKTNSVCLMKSRSMNSLKELSWCLVQILDQKQVSV